MNAKDIIDSIEAFRRELDDLPIGEFPEKVDMVDFVIKFSLIKSIGVKEYCRVKKLAEYIMQSTRPGYFGERDRSKLWIDYDDLIRSWPYKCTVCAIGLLYDGPAADLVKPVS